MSQGDHELLFVNPSSSPRGLELACPQIRKSRPSGLIFDGADAYQNRPAFASAPVHLNQSALLRAYQRPYPGPASYNEVHAHA